MGFGAVLFGSRLILAACWHTVAKWLASLMTVVTYLPSSGEFLWRCAGVTTEVAGLVGGS